MFSGALLFSGLFAYAQAPTISSFSPTSGAIGTVVTITGANFSITSTNNMVFFGAVRATSVTATNTNTLQVVVPLGANYQYISVTNGVPSGINLTAYSAAPFVVTFPSNGITDFNNDGALVGNGTPINVALGDLNGDGLPDLIVANNNNGYASVFRNASVASGSLSFVLVSPTLSTGVNTRQISTVDLDGDGKLDLAIAQNNNNSTVRASSDYIRLFRNTTTVGSNTITFTTGPTNVPSASGVNIADFDGDGKPDIVALVDIQNQISIFRNLSVSGTITFTATPQTFNFTAGASGNFVAIGDLDQDGKPDVVVSTTANTLSIFHNQSTPGNINFVDTFASNIDLTIGFTAYGIAIADFDNDSNPDIVVTDQSNGRIVFFRNTNNGSSGTISFPNIFSFAFATAAGTASTGNIPYTNLSVADFDGDGKVDVSVSNESSGINALFVLKNTSVAIGNLNFSNRTTYATGTDGWHLVAGDMNLDGKPDIAVANVTTNTISLFRNVVTISNPPVISAISSLSGVSNKQISISGSGFNINPLSNTVFFWSNKCHYCPSRIK